MVIENVKQVPYNVSLLGVVHGIANSYGMELSAAEVFGGTGNAFIVNIHEALCPSGPYVWDPEPFFTLSRNIGLDITDLGFFGDATSMDERAKIEADLRDILSRGVLCGVLNMENQIIYGFDESGFLLTVPWDDLPITPPRLTFDTWQEFGDEIHANFCSFEQIEPADQRTSAAAALRFALELYEHPKRYNQGAYKFGPEAYENWVSAIESGHGGEHGAWWNAMVWGDSRRQAADYLKLIGERFSDVETDADKASELYRRVGDNLISASDKEMANGKKLEFIEGARDTEAETIPILTKIADAL